MEKNISFSPFDIEKAVWPKPSVIYENKQQKQQQQQQ